METVGIKSLRDHTQAPLAQQFLSFSRFLRLETINGTPQELRGKNAKSGLRKRGLATNYHIQKNTRANTRVKILIELDFESNCWSLPAG